MGRSSSISVLKRLAMAGAGLSILSAAAYAPSAYAQEKTAPFDIPTQPLSSGLLALGRQAAISIAAPQELISGKSGPAIRGQMTIRDALGRLLDGSGLSFQFVSPTAVRIVASKPAAEAARPAAAEPVETAGATIIPEIVVTAQRRSEKLQNVPIAVTALTANDLQSGGVESTADLIAVIPGLNFSKAVGAYGLPVIRGVGTTSQGPGIENPVATYIDGVYLVGASGALMSLNDVAQVAVLKGPQGTLFGRNATGGLIQVTTKTPTHDFHADAEATVGNLSTFGQALYVTGGLTDTLMANFTLSHEAQDQGFGRNLTTGQYVYTHHDLAMRGKLLWRPDDRTDITLSADYADHVGAEPANRALTKTVFNAYMPGGPFDIAADVQPHVSVEGAGTSLNITREFGAVQFVSTTAYRQSHLHTRFDADGTVTPILTIDQIEQDRQLSQEFQLISSGDHRLNWVAGAFFMSADSKYNPATTISKTAPGPILLTADQALTSYAVFGQATYKIDDATNFTGGLRYSQDRRGLKSSQIIQSPFGLLPAGGPLDTSKTFGQPTWRLALDHRFSSELMIYASYNRGFRSGTFAPQIFPAKVLDPETIDAYETGFKSDLLDRRLRVNAAAFYYDYKNRQVLAIVNGFQQVYSADRAVSYGVDADATLRVTGRFTITAGASAIHARYTAFNNAILTTLLPFGGDSLVAGSATGKALENTPEWTLNIGPAYRMPTSIGEFKTSLNYYHSNGWFAGPDNRARQPAYDTLAADMLWTPSFSSNLTVRFWGRNLTNTAYATQLTETGFSDNRNAAPGRTYGVTLGVHF